MGIAFSGHVPLKIYLEYVWILKELDHGSPALHYSYYKEIQVIFESSSLLNSYRKFFIEEKPTIISWQETHEERWIMVL